MKRRSKISITLRDDLLEWIERRADEENKSKSRFIEDLLLPKMEEDLE